MSVQTLHQAHIRCELSEGLAFQALIAQWMS
jgi:hypothetical protein